MLKGVGFGPLVRSEGRATPIKRNPARLWIEFVPRLSLKPRIAPKKSSDQVPSKSRTLSISSIARTKRTAGELTLEPSIGEALSKLGETVFESANAGRRSNSAIPRTKRYAGAQS